MSGSVIRVMVGFDIGIGGGDGVELMDSGRDCRGVSTYSLNCGNFGVADCFFRNSALKA